MARSAGVRRPASDCARASLAAFMDAVVIVDPVQYQRRRDERDGVAMPLRSLRFGPDGGGLVTFLVAEWIFKITSETAGS
jgi:hypothetical protein